MSALAEVLAIPSREWGGAMLKASLRYAVSAAGPVAVSAAHFIASLIFLRLLKAGEFGQFSFLLIVVPFCLSASGALLGAPAALTRGKDEATAEAEILALQKASLAVGAAAGLIVTLLMLSTSAPFGEAMAFGLYGAFFVLRSFARSRFNIQNRLVRVTASDVVYAALLVGGLAALIVAGCLTMQNAAMVLAAAAALAFAPFGLGYFRELIRALGTEAFARYRPMWLSVTRWSLLGVVLTELTANAHAYSVTLLNGPKAFGLLALGALFMRPAALVLQALPDIDQPVMARRIAQGDVKGALRAVYEFRTAAGAVLAATVLASLVIVICFPHLFAAKGYDWPAVLIVVVMWIAITALRAARTPDAVLLQAVGDYAGLARIGMWSCAVSLSVTLALLLLFGPLASLGGVLAGEILIVAMIFPRTAAWRRQHG
jgi:hypothetical protein